MLRYISYINHYNNISGFIWKERLHRVFGANIRQLYKFISNVHLERIAVYLLVSSNNPIQIESDYGDIRCGTSFVFLSIFQSHSYISV